MGGGWVIRCMHVISLSFLSSGSLLNLALINVGGSTGSGHFLATYVNHLSRFICSLFEGQDAIKR